MIEYMIVILVLIVFISIYCFLKHFIEGRKKHENTLEILNNKKELLLKEQFLLNKKIVTSVIFDSVYKERLQVLNQEIVSLQKLFLKAILNKYNADI